MVETVVETVETERRGGRWAGIVEVLDGRDEMNGMSEWMVMVDVCTPSFGPV